VSAAAHRRPARVRFARVAVRLAIVAAWLAAIVLAGELAGIVHMSGWDWSAGSDTAYCGLYLPHADAYCQAGH